MSLRGAILIFLSAALTTCANLILRTGLLRAGGLRFFSGMIATQFIALCREPLVVAGFMLYGLAAVVWFGVISIENLSTCYPILVGLTFVMVTTGAVLLFGESISARKIAGALIILLGVLVVAGA